MWKKETAKQQMETATNRQQQQQQHAEDNIASAKPTTLHNDKI
jgi:hypothetical protein